MRGKSKLMTTLTAWMSIPRVNRSVLLSPKLNDNDGSARLTRADEVSGHAVPEVVEDTVSVRLKHLGVE